MTDAPQLLLLRAIEKSGLSSRVFAREVVVRDERTVRRWLAGDVDIPQVVLEKLASYLSD